LEKNITAKFSLFLGIPSKLCYHLASILIFFAVPLSSPFFLLQVWCVIAGDEQYVRFIVFLSG
jgi:hypothetical protein